MSERKVWGAVLILCLGSRLMSAVYYIEDLDSLRFALGVVDYDVTKLQPHFPAYPVFCFFAKAIYALTDRYAVAFAVLGGIATFGIIYFALGIAQIKITTPLGLIAALLLFFNPLLWLMSNRYMPDALGVAGVLACCYFAAKQESGKAGLGFFVAGLSLGVRLSYAPMLLLPLLLRLKERGPRLQFVAAGAAGVAVWLIPLIAVTGWTELTKAAQTQTQGHFADFGGTVATEPDFALRSIGLFEGIWADGFGLYWEGRHVVTACTTVALLGILVVNWRAVNRSVLLSAPFIGCVLYLGLDFPLSKCGTQKPARVAAVAFFDAHPSFCLCSDRYPRPSAFSLGCNRLFLLLWLCDLAFGRPAQKAYGHRSDTPIPRGKRKRCLAHCISAADQILSGFPGAAGRLSTR